MADFFHRYVVHNLGLKLISLALAVGLWLAVARDPMSEIPVDVPIEFHNIPENLEISSENLPQAQIRECCCHRLDKAARKFELILVGSFPVKLGHFADLPDLIR